MALSGWYNLIRVQLGTEWLGVNSMDAGDWLVLAKYSATSTDVVYTENDTDTADDDHNRLKITITYGDNDPLDDSYSLKVEASLSDSWGLVADYELQNDSGSATPWGIFDWTPQSDLDLDDYNDSATWLDDSGDLYLNNDVLSAMEQYDPDIVTVSPVVLELTPITPAVTKIATPDPVVVELTPITPQYVGEPPIVASPSPVVLELTPITPAVTKIATPDPVVLELTPITPLPARTVTPSPVVLEVTPITPKYVGGPLTTRTPSPVVLELTPITPAVRRQFAGSMSGRYRIFNDAAYRFVRSSSAVPQEDDSPYATASALPDTPTDTFGNGTWRISAAYYNGCLQSGFFPVDDGRTYHTLEVSGGVEVTPPPAPHKLTVLQDGDGIVRICGLYVLPDSETYNWAIAYTTNGSSPTEDTPDVTQATVGETTDILVYDLPSQAAGTTVKARVQIRRFDDPAWVYSSDSEIYTVVIDSDPDEVTSADKMVGRLSR